MFKQIILPILGVIAFIIVVGLFVPKSGSIVIPGITPTATTSPSKTISIGEKVINTEVADTKDKRTLGLSGRESLPENNGMVFVFDTKDVNTGFWMKDMKIALDIIWINDNKIVKIDKNVPFPASGTNDERLPVYTAGQPIDYVLEVNSGYSDKNGIKVGDSVDLKAL